MRYNKKIVKLPQDMVVGAEVGVSGEGRDKFTITEIHTDDSGDVTDVSISSPWREPLCKIYLLRGRDHSVAMNDPTSWIDVAIGECDVCHSPFPDSCCYERDENMPGSMICMECAKK